jgi:hypothetical protein
MLAALDGCVARREVLEERLSRLAQDDRLWPTVARLRCFRGIDTLTALTVHLELGGNWQRFSTPRKLAGWLMRDRGKPHNVTTVAVARELTGFLWAAATAP